MSRLSFFSMLEVERAWALARRLKGSKAQSKSDSISISPGLDKPVAWTGETSYKGSVFSQRRVQNRFYGTWAKSGLKFLGLKLDSDSTQPYLFMKRIGAASLWSFEALVQINAQFYLRAMLCAQRCDFRPQQLCSVLLFSEHSLSPVIIQRGSLIVHYFWPIRESFRGHKLRFSTLN